MPVLESASAPPGIASTMSAFSSDEMQQTSSELCPEFPREDYFELQKPL
jgi:hypothetical protein